MEQPKWLRIMPFFIILTFIGISIVQRYNPNTQECEDNPIALKANGIETEAYFFNYREEMRETKRSKALFKVIDYAFCVDTSILIRTKILGRSGDRFERFAEKNLIFKLIYEKDNICNREINFYWQLDSVSNPCLKKYVKQRFDE